jgi:site-specific DNA recombinase
LQEKLFQKFEQLEVRIVSIQERDLSTNDPSRLLIRRIIGSVSEFERSLIYARTKNGRENAFKSGYFPGGGIGFGFRLKKLTNGRKVIIKNKKQESIVEKIFKLRTEGNSIRQIANILNENGVKSTSGKKWAKSSIHYILSNEKYKGIFAYGKLNVRKPELEYVK